MIVSSALNLATSDTLISPGRPGRKYVGIQNTDVANFVVITFGGNAAVLSPPNGVKVGPGEFYEAKDVNINGPIRGISSTGAVDIVVRLD